MAANPLARKLLIKPGNRLLVLNRPADWLERLGPLPDGVEVAKGPAVRPTSSTCSSRARRRSTPTPPAAIQATRPGGVRWASYPKRSAKVATDLTRDVGWEAFAEAGWRPVTQVAVDDVWSALRFRPVADVGR